MGLLQTEYLTWRQSRRSFMMIETNLMLVMILPEVLKIFVMVCSPAFPPVSRESIDWSTSQLVRVTQLTLTTETQFGVYTLFS